MAMLMLCDHPVYDISKHMILDHAKCPFVHSDNPKKAYETWRKHRSYLKTNRTAERVILQSGGKNTREAKRRLSLSDCYWIQYDYDANTPFGEITPYKNTFSTMDVHRGNGRSSSVPELVLGGSQPKQWGRGQDGITYMSKAELGKQVHAEMLAVKLAHQSRLKAMNAFVRTEKGKIYANAYPTDFQYQSLGLIQLVNITSTERSMIQFDQLGIHVNGYHPLHVAEAYAKAGVMEDVTNIALTQILFDAVVGNIDRETNNGNWAIFLDHNTGKRTPSWMYDFNWANISIEATDMIGKVAGYVRQSRLEDKAIELLMPIKDACGDLGLGLWYDNARELLRKFGG